MPIWLMNIYLYFGNNKLTEPIVMPAIRQRFVTTAVRYFGLYRIRRKSFMFLVAFLWFTGDRLAYRFEIFPGRQLRESKRLLILSIMSQSEGCWYRKGIYPCGYFDLSAVAPRSATDEHQKNICTKHRLPNHRHHIWWDYDNDLLNTPESFHAS